MRTKKLLLIVVVAAILLTVSFLVGTGFSKRTDVSLADFSVSDDRTELTLKTSVMSSMGYVRGFQSKGGGVKPHYLTFYATFGGLNSTWGAKNEFVLEVSEDDSQIYFNRPGGGYELVLQRNTETGLWERP